MLLVEDSNSVLLAISQQQDTQRFLSSLAMLWSHWLPNSPAGIIKFSTISGTSSGLFWFSFSFTLQHSPEFWASGFLHFLWGGSFLRSFLGQQCLSVVIHSHGYPRHLEKIRGSTELNWFGEEGEDSWKWWLQEKGCGQRWGMCQKRRREWVFWGCVNRQEQLGWVQLTWHFFWTSFGRRASSFHPGYIESAVP